VKIIFGRLSFVISYNDLDSRLEDFRKYSCGGDLGKIFGNAVAWDGPNQRPLISLLVFFAGHTLAGGRSCGACMASERDILCSFCLVASLV